MAVAVRVMPSEVVGPLELHIPSGNTEGKCCTYDNAKKMGSPSRVLNFVKLGGSTLSAKGKMRRNAPWPCGSDLKYKRCHGL